MLRLTLSLTACGILCLPASISAQRPEFEVASVRLRSLNSSEDRVQFLTRITEGRVDLVQSLRTVLLRAFEVQDHQLILPEWAEQMTVDIRATIPPDVTTRQLPEMLRRLLVDRFGLVTHAETRPMNTYQLLVGANGIKMRAVEAIDELDQEFDTIVLPNGRPISSVVTQTPEGRTRTIQIPGGLRRLTARTRYDLTYDNASNTKTVDAVRMTMAELVPILTTTLGEPVIDGTNLNEIFQFRLTLPADDPAIMKLIQRLGGAGTLSSAPFGGSPFKAVEALGLQLERRRAPVDVIVVDSMRREPTEN